MTDSTQTAKPEPEAQASAAPTDGGALLVVTVLMNSSARPAAITVSHGDAIDRAIKSSAGEKIAGIELAELSVSPKAFSHLKQGLNMPPSAVALYDIFPLANNLTSEIRTVAGQFLAAEALWALEAQGLLGGVPPAENLALPKGWSKDPKEIRERLVEAGATALPAEAIESFQKIKRKWDESATNISNE